MLYPLPKPGYGTVVQILFDQVNDINAAVADVKSKNIRCLSAEPRIGQSYRLDTSTIIFYLMSLVESVIGSLTHLGCTRNIPLNYYFTGAHGKPVMFLHPKDCNGVLVELEQE